MIEEGIVDDVYTFCTPIISPAFIIQWRREAFPGAPRTCCVNVIMRTRGRQMVGGPPPLQMKGPLQVNSVPDYGYAWSVSRG